MLKWIRIVERGNKRWHAVYCTQFGLYFTFCARTVRIGYENGKITEDPPTRCGCCQSRIRNPFNVPETLRAIRNGTITPIKPSRQRARRHGEISMAQGKLYA